MLLRSERKFHHAFQELVRRQADEVVHDELLGIEADEVAQLQRLAARGIDEIPVPVVDHDDVRLCTHWFFAVHHGPSQAILIAAAQLQRARRLQLKRSPGNRPCRALHDST